MGHQKQHFWSTEGSRGDRKDICYNSAGGPVNDRCGEWRSSLLQGEGRNCPVDFDWGLHSATRRSWLLSRWEQSMSLSKFVKLLLLQAYSPRTLGNTLFVYSQAFLWNMALIPFNSWYSIQFNSFKYKNWVLRGAGLLGCTMKTDTMAYVLWDYLVFFWSF